MTQRTGPGPGARLGLLLLGLVLSIGVIEIFIRVWAVTVEARDELPSPTSGHEVVLCIGDSHTWGRGTGYPQRLSKLLAERSDRYRVINLGVPGTNTAQLRERLPEQIDRYQPSLLVVWSGVNNSWNQAAAELRAGDPDLSWLDRLARISRIVRLARVWLHQRELQELLVETGPYVVPDASVEKQSRGARYERDLGGDRSAYVNEGGGTLEGDALSAETREDLVWIVEHASARGIQTILVAYGLPGGRYGEASVGVRDAARTTGAGLVEASRVGAAIASDFTARGMQIPRLYDDTVHPRQILYQAIGDRILEVADERGWLPAGG